MLNSRVRGRVCYLDVDFCEPVFRQASTIVTSVGLMPADGSTAVEETEFQVFSSLPYISFQLAVYIALLSW